MPSSRPDDAYPFEGVPWGLIGVIGLIVAGVLLPFLLSLLLAA